MNNNGLPTNTALHANDPQGGRKKKQHLLFSPLWIATKMCNLPLNGQPPLFFPPSPTLLSPHHHGMWFKSHAAKKHSVQRQSVIIHTQRFIRAQLMNGHSQEPGVILWIKMYTSGTLASRRSHPGGGGRERNGRIEHEPRGKVGGPSWRQTNLVAPDPALTQPWAEQPAKSNPAPLHNGAVVWRCPKCV